MAWLHTYGYDLAAWLFSATLIAGYYFRLGRRLRRDPTYAIQGLNNLARSLWVIHVMNTPGEAVMAVQTLRNFVMGASLMASTSALLIIGTLTLSGQAETIARSWHALSLVNAHSAEVWIIKVICLLVDFIVAFFAFAMSVRLANQVVFMINVPETGAHASLSPHAVAERLNRAGGLFSFGLRAFFVAVPLVFWLFGPLFLALATLGLVFVLHRLDRGDLVQG